jgi:phosphate transport system substrate-binding protein
MDMSNRIIPLISAATLLLLAFTGWAQPSQQQTVPLRLIAAGSGVNLGITRLLAAAFHRDQPHISIEVPGSIGTRGAIKAAVDGAVTFGLISRSLTKEEQALGLVAQPYARVAIVVAAHSSVEDQDITFQELIDIYKGNKTRWKDGNEIVVQAREQSDSGFLVVQREIPGFSEAYAESQQARRWPIYFTDQDANRALSTTPYAIGVTDLGMIATEQLNVKVFRISGVLPCPETLLSGQYPLARDLCFVYREGSLPAEAKAFLDFVRSEEGDKILRSNGYLPVH